jgi:uncharacterized protein YjbI with pentapeptide repeats
LANLAQLAQLKQGADAWNTWRQANKGTHIDLTGADLGDAHLDKIDLSGADLNGADLNCAELVGADLTFAILTKANLHAANLCKAQFYGANLFGADLSHAKLKSANLHEMNLVGQMFLCADLTGAAVNNSDLTGANLSGAILTDASFSIANLSGANLNDAILSGTDFSNANLSCVDLGNTHWDRSKMRGRYLGVRGLDSCFGNALFKRAAADQDFLDSLEYQWRDSKWWRFVFRMWGWLDFGRSISRVAALGLGIVGLFAAIYWANPALLNTAQSAHSWFTPFYFSIVTFTTLGFGDVRPAQTLAEILTSLEVVLGYLNLGLLLAVLAEKIARRS